MDQGSPYPPDTAKLIDFASLYLYYEYLRFVSILFSSRSPARCFPWEDAREISVCCFVIGVRRRGFWPVQLFLLRVDDRR
jgi:hypothetical protein